jgi:hypothetical protein
VEGDIERRAGVFISTEFGTVSRDDLVAAAREVADAGFDALITVAFSYEARATDFEKLGRIPVLKTLKMTLRAEINEEAWATLRSAVSRPFDKPASGRIAVKVINHLSDEVMKVYRV